MPTITVVNRQGEETTITGKVGRSLMEALKEGGVDEVLAMCGGCGSCMTCHVFADPSFADRLPPQGDDEYDLLSCSQFYDAASSRLACQIPVTEALDGLRVTVAPED